MERLELIMEDIMGDHLNPEESKALWQKVMSEIGKLPSLAEIIALLIKELEDESSTPESLEKIIINDTSLFAKILRIFHKDLLKSLPLHVPRNNII